MASIIHFSVTPARTRSGNMVTIMVHADFWGPGGVEVRIPDFVDAIFRYRGQLTKVLREPIGHADEERVIFRPIILTQGGSGFLMEAQVGDSTGSDWAQEPTVVDP